VSNPTGNAIILAVGSVSNEQALRTRISFAAYSGSDSLPNIKRFPRPESFFVPRFMILRAALHMVDVAIAQEEAGPIPEPQDKTAVFATYLTELGGICGLVMDKSVSELYTPNAAPYAYDALRAQPFDCHWWVTAPHGKVTYKGQL